MQLYKVHIQDTTLKNIYKDVNLTTMRTIYRFFQLIYKTTIFYLKLKINIIYVIKDKSEKIGLCKYVENNFMA